MSNPNAASRPPIELQSLSATNFDLSSAGLEFSVGAPSMQHPQLTLEGDKDAFEQSYVDGRLVVHEKDDISGSSGVTVVRSGGSTYISGGSGVVVTGRGNSVMTSYFGNDVYVDGVRVTGSRTVVGGNEGVRRRALLQIPEGQVVTSHDIKNVAGDVSLEAVNAQRLRVSTISGDIALRGVRVESVSAKSVSGDIDTTDLVSRQEVSMQSVSGDIDVDNGQAPGWNLSTVSGDVTTRGTQGYVNASSVSGKMRTR